MHWLRPNPGWLKNTLNHVYNAVITMIVTAAVQLGIWRLVDPGTLRNVGIIAVGIAGVVGFFALAVTRNVIGCGVTAMVRRVDPHRGHGGRRSGE